MSQQIPNLTGLPRSAPVASFVDKCLDHFPGIVFKYDVNRDSYECLNNKLQEYLGFTGEEFENLNYRFIDLVYNEDVESVSSLLEQLPSLVPSNPLQFTARFNRKEGGCRYLRNSCSRVDETSLLIFSEDVTDQVRFEDEAQAARQLFDETEKLLLFGSWSWSMKQDKVEWTEGMYELLGYDRLDEESVSNAFFMKHVLPEHRETLQLALDDAITQKRPFEVEFVVRTNTGNEKFVFTKGKPLLNKDGSVKKLVGITRDITAKKNFENERERNIRELNRSNKELEEFAYVASHDLHEPLRKVLTFSERLKGRFSESLGDDGKLYLDRIWASADSMRCLIDNLLEFSRMSRGARSFVSCDLTDVFREVLADQELRIEETSTVIRISELPKVEAVPSELKQLFNNLIGNALKFRKKDAPPEISISSRSLTHKEKTELLLPFNQTFYEIAVKDNGIGFESAYAEKIFEIFQRLHGKTEYAGSGIGLAICKKIVENHDGIIYAASEPGVGSVFSVILPEQQH